jgi:hypothetical protein
MSIDSFEVEGIRVKIEQDEGPSNPREEFDNAGKLFVDGGREYMDVDELPTPAGYPDKWATTGLREGWLYTDDGEISISGVEDIVALLVKAYPGCEVLEVSHNGRDGLLFMDRETMIKEWGRKKIVTPKVRALAKGCMESEWEEYIQWCDGEAYGYIVDEDGPDEDSCWGFFGFECVKEEATSIARHIAERRRKEAQYQETVMAGLCAGD